MKKMKTISRRWLLLLTACMILLSGSIGFAGRTYAGQNAIVSEQDGKKITLQKGKTKTLTITIGGKKIKGTMIKFTSNHPNIVKVTKNGKVKALRKGTAKITYYVKRYPWAVFKCKIVVKNKK